MIKLWGKHCEYDFMVFKGKLGEVGLRTAGNTTDLHTREDVMSGSVL